MHNPKKHPYSLKKQTIYTLFLFHAFSHPYHILTIPPTEEWCMCEEEDKYEEKEEKYAMQLYHGAWP
jgi:hypothetical protein